MNSKLQTAILTATALICVAFQLPTQARGHFDKATAQPSEENFKEGMKLMRAHNYEAAIDSFQQAVNFSRNHYNPEALKWLGLAYKATRQYSKAIGAFKQYFEQNTEKAPDVHIDLAECMIKIDDFDNAFLEINQAMAEQGTEGTARQNYAMGELYEQMDKTGEALGRYREASIEKKNYGDALMGMARCQVKLKQWKEGLTTYDDIMSHVPPLVGLDMVELYYNQGTCYLMRGDHQRALDCWRMALDRAPDNFDCHLALATMFDKEQHISSAIKEYEAALRNLPNAKQDQRIVIARRMEYLNQLIKPKETMPEMRPSPQMRQEYRNAVQQRDQENTGAPPSDAAPVSKDSGF